MFTGQLLGSDLFPRGRSRAPVAHAYNPSYSGGRDQEALDGKPIRANSSGHPILKKTIMKKK
jgi:hypothetical protein